MFPPMAHSNLEVEIKLPVSSLPAILERIAQAGWRLVQERSLESNTLLDTEDGHLRAGGIVLRLRQYAGRHVLTYKGPGRDGKHKVREELEVPLDGSATMSAIFERLGYRSSFRYEKYRTEFSDGTGHLTIDETPIGNYLELEGPPEWIDDWARRLGYSEQDYITVSYGRLYAAHCARQGIAPGDMVFEEGEGEG